MSKFKYSDIEDAFLYVSSGMYGMNSAVLSRDTVKIYYISDMSGMDETEEEEDLDWDNCVEIPHKNDLDLGKDLVFEFVRKNLPDDYEYVQDLFHRRGAYSRYKAWLEQKGLLEKWYDFENNSEEWALRRWCIENEIELE